MANATTDSTIILCFSAGKASGDLVGDHALIASIAGDNILGVNATNFISDDGTNSQTLAHGGFTATQDLVALLQTDISESKKRLGVWVNGAITWASWAAFDLSFDVESFLDFFVNSETMTYQASAIYSSLLSDADVTIEVFALGINKSPNAPTNPVPADSAVVPTATSVVLSIDVIDDNDAAVDVTFKNAATGAVIGTDAGVASGGTATVTWAGLVPGSVMTWKVDVVDDSGDTTTSATYSFTIQSDADPAGQSLLVGASLSNRVARHVSGRVGRNLSKRITRL